MRIGSLILKFLQNPWTIIAGVLLGFVSGFYLKDFSHSLETIADTYVALLSMCLLPILVSALIWGIGQMLRHPSTKELFGRMAVVYVVGLLVPAVVTIAVALVLQPGASLGDAGAAALGGDGGAASAAVRGRRGGDSVACCHADDTLGPERAAGHHRDGARELSSA